jgi:hypothetical protein
MTENHHAGLDPEDPEFRGEDGRVNPIKLVQALVRAEVEARLAAMPPTDQPLPAAPIALDAQVQGDDITQSLLNAQLLECVAILRDAGHLYRNTAVEPYQRGHFVDQTAKLMETSVQLADAINRLKGAPEPIKTTRHIVAVERVEGGGSAISKNE